jgi:CBS domain-containing protein
MTNVAYWPIRVRRTVEEGDETREARSVFCRALGASIDLEECLACPHAAGIRHDARGEASHAGCARIPTAGDPRPVALRGATTPAEATPLSSMMTGALWCIGPGVSIAAARGIFDERRIGALPVVDPEGIPIGILTRGDLPLVDADLTVGDAMSPIAFSLDERAPVAHAAAMMAMEGVHHLPVVASGGEVVGMVSSLDVTAWVARQAGYLT